MRLRTGASQRKTVLVVSADTPPVRFTISSVWVASRRIRLAIMPILSTSIGAAMSTTLRTASSRLATQWPSEKIAPRQ